MNYSSLVILSRCPQAPVPNLGQYGHQLVPPSSPSDEGQNNLPPSADAGDLPVPDISSTDVHTTSLSQRSTHLHDASQLGHCIPDSGVSSTAMSGPGNVTDTSSVKVLATADDDEFDDFKSAAVSSSPGNVSLNHSLSITHAHDSVPG